MYVIFFLKPNRTEPMEFSKILNRTEIDSVRFGSVSNRTDSITDSQSRMTNLNVHAKVFLPSKHLESLQSPLEQALHRLRLWNFATKDEKIVITLLEEWYTSRTLNSVLQSWKNANPKLVSEQKESLKILCYNVQGWYSRALEVIELVYKVEASICVFTEVGKLWNTCRLPHFNTFHQKGTNRNGGVSRGKQLTPAPWNQVESSGVRVESSGVRWSQLESGGVNGNQTDSTGIRRIQVDEVKVESEWSQVESSEITVESSGVKRSHGVCCFPLEEYASR